MGPDLQIAELTRSLEAGSDVYAIHYSCESFYDALDHPPGISCVSVSRIPSGDDQSFSRTDDPNPDSSELTLLRMFYAWLRDHPDARLVHWAMNKTDFGFAALGTRFVHLARAEVPVRHAQDRLFNLDELIAYRHGQGYARDPRLATLIRLNGLTTRFTLTGAEQAERFRQGKHAELARCTAERAHHISGLAQRFVRGALQTERSGPSVRFAGSIIDSVDVVLEIGKRVHEMAAVLARRGRGRPRFELNDEYDYQDLVHTFLRLFFDDVRPEEWGPSVAGAPVRIDFLLPEVGIAVELKAARESMSEGRLGDELIADTARYARHPDVRHLVCLVFDSERLLANPRGLEHDLSKVADALAVTVRIVRS